jgi:hypothetical protein
MRITMWKPLNMIFCRTQQLTISQQVRCFRARPYVIPPNPRTPDQMRTRAYLAAAKSEWNKRDESEKKVWSEFAQSQFRLSSREFPKRWRGIDAFCRASMARQVAGLLPLPALPEESRPSPVKSVKLLPGNGTRELVFSVTYASLPDGGYAMFVRATPTTVSPGRNPYKGSLRYVRGAGPESVFPLPPPGGVVRIDSIAFDLKPGMPYAVEVRIVRLEDGASSDTYYQIGPRQQQQETELAIQNREEQTVERPADDDWQKGYRYFPSWLYRKSYEQE